jgi:hypothetical protein
MMPSPTEPAVGTPGFTERRRYPRVRGSHIDVSVPSVSAVEVLEISSSGALLSTETPLKVGQRAHLRTLLSREPFSAWIEVIRVTEGTAAGNVKRHHFGVVFTSMDENSRKLLQRFAGI